MSVMEIHHELCAAVYGQSVMSEGTVRQWCRMFEDGHTGIHDEERSGRPSVVSDDLVKALPKKICEDSTSQFQNFHVNFHKFHALFSMILSQFG
jgi:transposase